ncbi:MAG: hypothetical protein WBA97_28275 [Actinophytocola sp.]|uniref:hypothetical protein n=1 Tax=Actinophytocola sp. TaxID=1872138 RepID=UPI003C70EFC8
MPNTEESEPLGAVAPMRLSSAVPAEPHMVARLSGTQLKAMATSGGFSVDDTTGNRMIHALEAALETLETRWADLEKLQHDPPMSESPAARWVGRHMVDTASDAEGLLTQLRTARREIPVYVAAIQLAKRTYRETETGVRGRLHGIRREIDPGEV